MLCPRSVLPPTIGFVCSLRDRLCEGIRARRFQNDERNAKLIADHLRLLTLRGNEISNMSEVDLALIPNSDARGNRWSISFYKHHTVKIECTEYFSIEMLEDALGIEQDEVPIEQQAGAGSVMPANRRGKRNLISLDVIDTLVGAPVRRRLLFLDQLAGRCMYQAYVLGQARSKIGFADAVDARNENVHTGPSEGNMARITRRKSVGSRYRND